jgi:type I restriction enzyme R subunit
MSDFSQNERQTQNRIVKILTEQLGYTYLGNWEDRENNSNIEEGLATAYLTRKGYNEHLISRALYQLKSEANNYNESLYTNNKVVYERLRFGVPVKTVAGKNTETVLLIDWNDPSQNDFGIAEEVTIRGERKKRPDIVLYVNGIALCVIELKRSSVSIGDGIRQNITNQQKEFIQSFFSTIQLVMAGNNWEGLHYGTIGTPEKYFMKWKEDVQEPSDYLLDKYLRKLCSKERLLEVIHDFIIFDGGIKKLARPHQYFGVMAARQHIHKKESGIIWHTQGSGKSLTMVMLAKWILEHNHNARVVIITDRDDLDKQIEGVFIDAGEGGVRRTRSAADLMQRLGEHQTRLVTSLVHKFGRRKVPDYDAFIEELKKSKPVAVGDVYVFVDECHRTQSGRLHKTMKAMLGPNTTFIGFTGTPLLKQDKQTSLEVFGKYIHTYKFNEAVADEVVRDLVYEARDIDQRISSPQKVDAWFASKTSGLNDFQRSELKKKWGTMQKVLSSKSRMDKIIQDILLDFNVKPRLNGGRGNAILVAGDIYSACRYFELFQQTELKGKCAVITSYDPSHRDIVMEDTGGNTETEKEYIYRIYKQFVITENGRFNSTEKYEDHVKEKFKKEPAGMKLLIVVDKLLTGFDAPPCTYLYIDKKMQDHGLFQAVTRVNRLDTDDKEYGYIIDYKGLFTAVESAVAVYTSELDYDNFKKEDVEILLKDRLVKGKERLDDALEQITLLCEAVQPPKEELQYVQYFCGDPENPQDVKDTEVKRTTFYKMAVALIRAYANISDEIEEAGYSKTEIEHIRKKLSYYLNIREVLKVASKETIDLKAFEADMRHMIDNYIQADESTVISPFKEGMTLLDLIVKTGIADAINALPHGIKKNRQAVAETIENNVRQKIISEHLLDPAYFEEMSKLLTEIIKARKAGAIEYEKYLAEIAKLAEKVNNPSSDNDVPVSINTMALRALYHNLGEDEALAIAVDQAVRNSRQADWRGVEPKERIIMHAVYAIMKDVEGVKKMFEIIRQQPEY